MRRRSGKITQGSAHPGLALLVALAPLAAAHAAAAPASAGSAAPVPTVELPGIVVTATRQARPAFAVPAAIDAVQLGRIQRTTADINPSEYLRQVPGVLARDRQNYAQDEQVSIRGFGSRATFGVRGVRLYVDGIPATMPDGQGQLSNFSLGAASRIEVLRGPFSALYGNSSGGVIQIFTADGTDPPQWRAMLGTGRHGARRLELGARGIVGSYGYNVDASRFRTDGFRRHSRARRDNGNAKLKVDLGYAGHLTLLANSVVVKALDPKGLTRAEYHADPRQAAPSALTYDTRKSVRQNQGGAIWQGDSGGGGQWRVLGYAGHRAIVQFLSVPVAAQADPLSSGGVIDLASDYAGADARWSWHGDLAGRPLDFTIGASWDNQDQHRLGYDNFVGPLLGVRGALRRDEIDTVSDFDQYAQASWDFAPRWSATAGLRHSEVHFDVDDHHVTMRNPDASSGKDYSASDPVFGLMFRASDDWHLYAAWGHGFETPTFSELSYRSDGATGLNFDLRAARSDNLEVGSKWRWGDGGKLDIALFRARTRDALAVYSNDNGRSTYSNVGRARRRGAELELHLPLAVHWRLQAAYTFLDARFRSTSSECARAADCAIRPGARIPGVPRQALNASLHWRAGNGWHAALALSAIGNVVVDDANSAGAPGYALLDASLGYIGHLGDATVAPFLRIDNLADRRYIGSVIVNEGNGRYFEPGPGRALFVGCRIRFAARD
ncbi:MAG TPA: TonB-dependent receptor [Rhodanobacteraceae bacterium]|nr:TonB-dependent receptor [Rhodanobacteraceae bacterium]